MQKPLALIVEDDRDISALFRHVLDIAGFHTEIFANGRDVIKRLGSMRPDIVLLDLNLPGVSGTKILEHMRASEILKAVPVVVVTAHAEVAGSLPVEPDLVLLKPVNLDQLSNLVQRLRTTPASMHETPWDAATHLYNRSFFTVRLTYSLDRVLQIGSDRFAVLFVDLDPFQKLREGSNDDELHTFLRETASHLKSVLRPTDTIARFDDGLFLVLVEDLRQEDPLIKITGRVQLEMASYLANSRLGTDLRAFVGVLLCDGSYANVDEILRDIEAARQFSRDGAFVIYNRDTLQARRGS